MPRRFSSSAKIKGNERSASTSKIPSRLKNSAKACAIAVSRSPESPSTGDKISRATNLIYPSLFTSAIHFQIAQNQRRARLRFNQSGRIANAKSNAMVKRAVDRRNPGKNASNSRHRQKEFSAKINKQTPQCITKMQIHLRHSAVNCLWFPP